MSATHQAPPAPPAAEAVPAKPIPTGAPQPAEAASATLVATLTICGALAGALIVMAFQWAQPRILAHQAAVTTAAVAEVLGGPERTQKLYLQGGKLSAALPAGVDSMAAEKLFAGYGADGKLIGFAIQGAEPGFADNVSVIFGYDPAEKRVLGMKVLDNKETPGLGDKIVKDSAFIGGFRGVAAPLLGVKQGAGDGAANEVDMITGATISSRVVIGVINHRIEAMAPLIDAYLKEGGQ